jgi:hypothetical protein
MSVHVKKQSKIKCKLNPPSCKVILNVMMSHVLVFTFRPWFRSSYVAPSVILSHACPLPGPIIAAKISAGVRIVCRAFHLIYYYLRKFIFYSYYGSSILD